MRNDHGGRFGRFPSDTQGFLEGLKPGPREPLPVVTLIHRSSIGTLYTWLRDNVYRRGSKFAPNDLVNRATGAARGGRRKRKNAPRAAC